jgi:hypothetical protein
MIYNDQLGRKARLDSFHSRRVAYVSARDRRASKTERMGYALIIVTLIAVVALFYGAYRIDRSRGISISESLASVGLGRSHRADHAAPFGTYSTRADAEDQAARLLDAGRCVRLEPVDDQITELQSC